MVTRQRLQRDTTPLVTVAGDISYTTCASLTQATQWTDNTSSENYLCHALLHPRVHTLTYLQADYRHMRVPSPPCLVPLALLAVVADLPLAATTTHTALF